MAPKRRRSPPVSNERSPKRRAQEVLEEPEPAIETRKKPPRQRLGGLGPPPPLAAPSRKQLSKNVPLPPPPSRQKQQQKEQPPPSPTSSSSLSIPSDSSDGEQEDAGAIQQQQQQGQDEQQEQQQYARVKTVRLGNEPRYRPLIPTTLDPFFFNPRNKKSLTTFGATFLNAEAAASAADRALIAMWGYESASPLLHSPQPGHYTLEEQQQRFGPELSSFLNDICEAAAVERKYIKNKKFRIRDRTSKKKGVLRTKIVHRVRDNKNLIDETKECGLCSACRQPWLGGLCERKQAARRIGYNSLKIAEMMLENGEDIPEIEDQDEERDEAGTDPSSSRTLLERKEIKYIKPKKSIKNKLLWLEEPPKGKPASLARDQHANHVECVYRYSDAMVTGEAAAEAAALSTAIETSHPSGAITGFTTKDIMMQPPQPALLRYAEECAAAGVDLALVEEDDSRWARAMDVNSIYSQCNLCYGWHSKAHLKECPVIQAAYAVEPPQKLPCSACGGLVGCKKCGRGDLPSAVWAPSSVPCTWMDNVNPATLDVMHGVQSMASAAAVDFDRTDIVGKLGPEALLALGLLAEEVAAAHVTATKSTCL